MKKILREDLRRENAIAINQAQWDRNPVSFGRAIEIRNLLDYVDELEDALENVLIFRDDHASHQHAKDLLEKNK